jgi:hypothetical protein
LWIRHTPLAALALALCLARAPVALAGFSLTTTAAPTVAVTLTGSDQTAPYTLDLTVDNSGIGSTTGGWHLTITSTQFSTGGATPRTLPTVASSIIDLTSVCAVGPCTDPANASTYPLAVPAGSPAPAPTTFFSTPALTGVGTFTVTPAVAVAIPANAYAGAYTSTLTLALAAGP